MSEAVETRIHDLLKKRKMSRRKLAEACNLPFETIGSIFKKLAKSVMFFTPPALCAGLGMTMPQFLDCEYFVRVKEEPGNSVQQHNSMNVCRNCGTSFDGDVCFMGLKI